MMQLVPFEPEHLKAYVENAMEPDMKTALTGFDYSALKQGKNEWTGLWDGVVVGSAGLIEIYPGRASVWAVLLPMPRVAFLSVHRAVKQFLDSTDCRRLEAQVDVRLTAAHRWMKLLGFEVETARKRFWLPSGGDIVEYVRFKEPV